MVDVEDVDRGHAAHGIEEDMVGTRWTSCTEYARTAHFRVHLKGARDAIRVWQPFVVPPMMSHT